MAHVSADRRGARGWRAENPRNPRECVRRLVPARRQRGRRLGREAACL